MNEAQISNILHIIEIISIIGGGGLGLIKLGRFLQRIEATSFNHDAAIGDLKTEIKKLNDVLTRLAVQDERLNAMQQQIDELRHGRGFVVEGFPPRHQHAS